MTPAAPPTTDPYAPCTAHGPCTAPFRTEEPQP